jgi:hypothetical protein
MPTFYESRTTGEVSPNYALALNSLNTSKKVPEGYVLLYQNSNYSNTTRQCAYLCAKNKVQWNGKVAAHNAAQK